MPYEVRTEIELEASPEQVWALLGDVENYAQWSRIFSFKRASVRPGGRAFLRANVGAPLPAYLPIQFDVIEPLRELRWHGGSKQIGYGSHYLILEALDNNRTRLVHGEDFEGLAIRASWPLIGSKLPGAYHAFNKEIVRRLAD